MDWELKSSTNRSPRRERRIARRVVFLLLYSLPNIILSLFGSNSGIFKKASRGLEREKIYDKKKSFDIDSSSLSKHTEGFMWFPVEKMTPALIQFLTDLRVFSSSGSLGSSRKMLEELTEKADLFLSALLIYRLSQDVQVIYRQALKQPADSSAVMWTSSLARWPASFL